MKNISTEIHAGGGVMDFIFECSTFDSSEWAFSGFKIKSIDTVQCQDFF